MRARGVQRKLEATSHGDAARTDSRWRTLAPALRSASEVLRRRLPEQGGPLGLVRDAASAFAHVADDLDVTGFVSVPQDTRLCGFRPITRDCANHCSVPPACVTKATAAPAEVVSLDCCEGCQPCCSQRRAPGSRCLVAAFDIGDGRQGCLSFGVTAAHGDAEAERDALRLLVETIQLARCARTADGVLVRAQRAASFGCLAGRIAHDFSNLVSCLSVGLSLASAELGADHPISGELTEMTDTIQSAGRMIRQLLAYSRPRPSPLSIVDVNQLLRDSEGMLAHMLGEDIVLELDLAASLTTVRAVAADLEQVLVILLQNARDAMPGAGHVRITTAAPEAPTDLRRVTLAVTDSGPGMDEETHRRAFEPGYATRDTTLALGVGLPVARVMTRKHRGELRIASTSAAGTTVELSLPAATADPSASEVSVTATTTETVLLVEDDARLRRATRRGLLAAGYRVIDQGSAEEALAWLDDAHTHVHLLVTDVVLPQMDGPTLADRIRARSPATRALFTSGQSGDRLAERYPERFLREPFLPKPYALPELVSRMRQALADERPG